MSKLHNIYFIKLQLAADIQGHVYTDCLMINLITAQSKQKQVATNDSV